MDEKTARQYRDAGQLPSRLNAERTWRTRPDPFKEVWPGLKQMLDLDDGLEAKTLFEYLQREDPGRFADGQLRTLQRRVKVWRALEGPAKETYFAQIHEPGRLCHHHDSGPSLRPSALPFRPDLLQTSVSSQKQLYKDVGVM